MRVWILGSYAGGKDSPQLPISLQLAPDEVAAITGLRQMFTYIGMIFSVSIVTAILNHSASPGVTQEFILWVVAGILLIVMVPLVFRVPEHKGTW